MDEESILQNLNRLEDRVESLFRTVEELRATNAELESMVTELEGELQRQNAESESLQEERALVRSKIDSLLSRLGQAGGTPQAG